MSVQKNDVFSLDHHVLGCGDARDPEMVQRICKDRSIPLILSDMPYGIRVVESKANFRQSANRKVMANDHFQSDSEYRKFTSDWLNLVKPFLAKKNSYYLFNSDKMLFAMRDGILDAGFKFAQLLIWVKNNAPIGRLDYLPQFELIGYGWLGVHAFRKSQDRSVIAYPKPNKSPLHPTMKPVGLLRRFILNSSTIGDYVYDPFAGAGSLGIACEQTRRKALMIEIDQEYCQVIIERFKSLTGIEAKKL
jgi:site-specific DNA-methyltransferase (adenine-specific)